MWQRAGVLGHVSDSTPLVIPYRSIGARERTPGPKPNCACTALLRPLPSFFSRPKGRESTLVLHWTSFTLEANSRPELPTLGPFSPFFASGVDSRPKKSKNSLDSRPSGLGSGGVTRGGFLSIKAAPHFFGQHNSPSNMAESRYPQRRLKLLQICVQ